LNLKNGKKYHIVARVLNLKPTNFKSEFSKVHTKKVKA
jgi:hypothetical protein